MEKLLYLALLSAFLVAGCSKDHSDTKKAESVPKPTSMPSLAGLADTSTTAAPAAPDAASVVSAAPAEGATSATGAKSGDSAINGVVLTRDEEGKVLTGEQILYKAIEIYVEGRGKPWPSDPNELVREGVLKSLPAAPAGKRWVVDNKKFKVLLENL